MPVKIERATRWSGCYGRRGDLFTQDSNKHPAKMAVQLCYRIFEHGQKRGYWSPGDTILDPMGGIGTTGIVGASLGYNVVLVELEHYFLSMAAANIWLLRTKMPNASRIELLQGDARQFEAVLAQADAGVCSPPYGGEPRQGSDQHSERQQGSEWSGKYQGGCHPGRLKGASYNKMAGAVTSPVYGDTSLSDGSGVSWKVRQIVRKKGIEAAVRFYRTEIMDKLPKHGRWSDENIRCHIETAMRTESGSYAGAVSSPPWQEQPAQQIYNQGKGFHSYGQNEPKDRMKKDYVSGQSPAQIGNLPDPKGDIETVLSGQFSAVSENKKESYLSAMRQVYAQLHLVLKPDGVVCLVTKNPVKKGQIRRLDSDTIRLMEACGFIFLERQMAILAEELGIQQRLDGGADTIRREHKSFFKRLFERKYPELRVDHEDILWFRKC